MKANVPGFFWTNVMLSAAHGQLENSRLQAMPCVTFSREQEDFARSRQKVLSVNR